MSTERAPSATAAAILRLRRRGVATATRPYGRLEVVAFNIDGRGSALVRPLDKADERYPVPELQVLDWSAVQVLLCGDGREEPWYLEDHE
jgi:hypothetical protein